MTNKQYKQFNKLKTVNNITNKIKNLKMSIETNRDGVDHSIEIRRKCFSNDYTNIEMSLKHLRKQQEQLETYQQQLKDLKEMFLEMVQGQ